MILILGGTSDSIDLARKLWTITPNFVLSTATEYGGILAEESFRGKVISGKMDKAELEAFCIKYAIRHILDATHPYAELISEHAIQICKELDIVYWRYQRPRSIKEEQNHLGIISCNSYKEAGEIVNAGIGTVLVTTGSRHIEKLIESIEDLQRIYVRVLPHSEHLMKLEALKLQPKQIMAIQGPFTKMMNLAMLEHIQAKYLITKDSGEAGKTDEKIQSALEHGAQVIVINRPPTTYPNVYDNMKALISNLLARI
jgi:precorrin-6A/cobalt-precorrin-6A reductase